MRKAYLFLLLLLSFLPALAWTGPAGAAPLKLLAFGDSLVQGYGLPTEDSFPSQLEAALRAAGQEVTVLNAGNSGDTTAAALARLSWSLADTPDAALVVLGGNDALRGLDPEETEANLRMLLTRLRRAGIPTLLAGLLAPRNLGEDYVRRFDGLFARVARAEGSRFYPFFLEGVAAEPSLNQPDGIHPNREGVARIVARMLPAVRDLLREARAEAP